MDRFSKIAVLLVAAVMLSACLEESGNSAPAPAPPAAQPAPSLPPEPAPPAPSVEVPAEKPAPEAVLPPPSPPDQPTTEPEDTAPLNTDVTLSWTAPLTRENGTPLLASEIQAYEIYYCVNDCQPEGSGTTIEVPGTPTKHTITLTEPGTWHFAVAVIDHDGLKSPLSNMVTVEITP